MVHHRSAALRAAAATDVLRVPLGSARQRLIAIAAARRAALQGGRIKYFGRFCAAVGSRNQDQRRTPVRRYGLLSKILTQEFFDEGDAFSVVAGSASVRGAMHHCKFHFGSHFLVSAEEFMRRTFITKI